MTNHFTLSKAVIAVMTGAALALSSCGSVFDDLDPCRGGLAMRFVYDYNLESANAFPAQVDCITLHIYDDSGRYMTTVTETSSVLADENWRMNVDLDPGTYHAVAYGGIACDQASFGHANVPAEEKHYSTISMQLLPGMAGTRLHDHFHGAVDFTVSADALDYTEVTMRMTKTTNHLRIILQQLDGKPVDGNDFEFYITDDNTVLDHTNRPVAGYGTTYKAWRTGQLDSAPEADAESRDYTGDLAPVGYADLSTSRLHLSTSPQLVIYSKEHNQNIVELPLNTYLTMANDGVEGWGDQEYLDRCSRWNLTFFLDRNNLWADTRIIINGWTVRINDLK